MITRVPVRGLIYSEEEPTREGEIGSTYTNRIIINNNSEYASNNSDLENRITLQSQVN